MLKDQPIDLTPFAPIPRRAPVGNALVPVIVGCAERLKIAREGRLPHVTDVLVHTAATLGLGLDSDRANLVLLARLLHSRSFESHSDDGPRWTHWRGDASHLVPGLTLTCRGRNTVLLDGMRELLAPGEQMTIEAMRRQLCPQLPPKKTASMLGCTLDLLQRFGAAVEHPCIVPDRSKKAHFSIWSRPAESYRKHPLENPELVLFDHIARSRGVVYDLLGPDRIDPITGFRHNCIIAARQRLEEQGIITSEEPTLNALRAEFSDPRYHPEFSGGKTLMIMRVSPLTRHFITRWAETPIGGLMDPAGYDYVRRIIVDRATPGQLLAEFVGKLPEREQTLINRVQVKGTSVAISTFYLPQANSIVVALGNGVTGQALETPLQDRPRRAPTAYDELEPAHREAAVAASSALWRRHGPALAAATVSPASGA